MDAAGYVHKRKARHMAQVLEAFEERVEPHLPPDAEGDKQDFKARVRAALNALASEACDVIASGGQVNGLALEMRDQLSPTGRT